MKHFVSPAFRLSTLPSGMKVIYTLFLIFITAGYATNFFLQYAKTGFTYRGVVEYYCGTLDAGEAGTGEGEGLRLREPMSAVEILLTTHMHLFIMPVIFLILVHMFFMTSLGHGWKMAGMVLPFLGLAMDLACPWLIRFVAPEFAAAKLGAVALMAFAFVCLVLIPLYDMWFSKGPQTS